MTGFENLIIQLITKKKDFYYCREKSDPNQDELRKRDSGGTWSLLAVQDLSLEPSSDVVDRCWCLLFYFIFLWNI